MKMSELLKRHSPPCRFLQCKNAGISDHHITYEPEVVVNLCVEHHEQITIINGQQARKYRGVLSNSHRWCIFNQWLQGKLKPRRTEKAMEYIGKMRSYRPGRESGRAR
jgi:hypothetical protein